MRPNGRKDRNPADVKSWVEEADQLAQDLQERMSQNEERLELLGDKAHPRQTNPRRVARIMSEGGIDKAEKDFQNADIGEADQAREQLIGQYDAVTSSPEYGAAMQGKRQSVSEAKEARSDLMSEQNTLGKTHDKVLQDRFDMRRAQQAGLTEFRSGTDLPEPENTDGGPSLTQSTTQTSAGNFDPNDSSLKNEGLAMMGMGSEEQTVEMEKQFDNLISRAGNVGSARDEVMEEAEADPQISFNMQQMQAPGPDNQMNSTPGLSFLEKRD